MVLKMPPASAGGRKVGADSHELVALRAQIESDQRLLIQFAEEKVQLAVQVGAGGCAGRPADLAREVESGCGDPARCGRLRRGFSQRVSHCPSRPAAAVAPGRGTTFWSST